MKLKKAKKVLCTSLALIIGGTFSGYTPLEIEAAFEKTANEIVEDIGFGWNLGNSLDSYVGTTLGCQDLSSETSWGNPKTTQTLIDGVKESGVNAIRVPVTWYNHMDSNYNIDDAWMDRVEEVVNYVLNNDDTYCILNVHHDTGENGWLKASSTNLDTKKEMFTAIWEQICERFGNYGDKLIFEGFNEILDDNSEWVNPSKESLNIVNDLNQMFVDTVRDSGGNNTQRCLIVNTYAASGNPYVTSNFEVPTDTASNKIIAECHVYQPFYFTSEHYPEETTWEQNKYYLDEQLDAIYNNFVQKGVPAIIGEFGCAYTKDNMNEIISWAKYYVETCTEYGIPCIYWDNGSQYKLYNRTTGAVTQPDLLGTMLAASEGESYEIDTTLYGDADNNGSLETNDIKQLQNYLVKKTNTVSNCDMNKDNNINIFDLIILKRTMVQKDNMCSSIDNWSSWVDSSAGAEADVVYTDNGVTVDVKNGGVNPWEVQVAYKNLTLEQGATYRLEFDYSATVAQSMDGNVMQNYGDYLPYHTVNLDYTTETQHHESTFTMEDATDKNTQIAFNCGGSSMIPCKIEISNLSLVKISDGSSSDNNDNNDENNDSNNDNPDDNDNTEIVEGENLCADLSNWGGWYSEDDAAAEIKAADNGITINVTDSGTEDWHIQGSYANLTLVEGTTYRVEFDYSSTAEAPLGFHIQQNYDPYGQYHYETIDSTSDVQHYTAEFTMTETDDNVVCTFNCGGISVVPCTFEISNLSLVSISGEESEDDSNNSNDNDNSNAENSGNEINTNADMVADLRNGASSYFFASGPWTNGGVFDCGWTSSNITFTDVMNITITDDPSGTYNYLSGEYRTKEKYGYGYYECSMMPIKADGVDTGFFMYTGPSDGDPWDEIDFEFLGYDTTKVQLNYYTDGVGGHEYMLDLGFDASEGYHTYGFDWQPDHITWYVDGVARYTATENLPTNPGRIMVNAWPGIGVDEWLKPFEGNVPLTAKYQWITWSENK